MNKENVSRGRFRSGNTPCSNPNGKFHVLRQKNGGFWADKSHRGATMHTPVARADVYTVLALYLPE